MLDTDTSTDIAALPLAPRNPLSVREQVAAIAQCHGGIERLRDTGGKITRLKLGPKWLFPEIVLVTSPQAARDVLSASGSWTDVTLFQDELCALLGPALLALRHKNWRPRRRALQPAFTKSQVRAFGGHMAQAAETIAATWQNAEEIDLEAECRQLTMRALGRSILGLDLDEHTEAIDEPLRVVLGYVTQRATKPIRPPRWLPTRARRRAVAAKDTLHGLAKAILQACREDPDRDAPLVHALMAASDPDTGRKLSDKEIHAELVVFIYAGHDTTAMALTCTLWALGRYPDIQERVRAEAAAIGDRELTPDDVSRLGYTIRVIQEALRLCPPTASVARVATKDIEVAGYRVEAGTMCSVGIFALQRDPEIWERALEFDPDRFSPENSAGRDRWQYIPFGAGPRSCIGNHFAMLEATLAVATIIRSHEIISVSEDFPLIVPYSTDPAPPARVQVRARTG
ncbi:cytochrome P450 [Mycobacterium szulgai]|uniref:cytochrome P450 n=1 Tax=Mycobacterium szulgai TaxID=1787 RepID=UPI0021F39F50|nr:cytochrome P450 [Mycobacterium szulgai]MCV7076856.1 cytochrome P450 [Mycobacterium szulgai]